MGTKITIPKLAKKIARIGGPSTQIGTIKSRYHYFKNQNLKMPGFLDLWYLWEPLFRDFIGLFMD